MGAQSELKIIINGVDAGGTKVIDDATRALDGLGGIASKVGVILTVGLGAAIAGVTAAIGGIGAGLAFSFGEAMQAQEGLAQLGAVLKSTGGAAGVTQEMATKLADSLSGVTRFSDDAVLAGENMLLTFTGIGKDVFPDATETLLDMATAMKMDTKSAAMQLGKALNNPAEGLAALTRVGVTFTDEQKYLVESLVKSGKTAEAQKVILQELQKEFGGSAEAAGQTFAGQMDILKNQLSNVAETIGLSLLPIAQQFLDDFIKPALPFIQDLGNALAGFFQALGEGDIGGAFDALGEFESVQKILDLLGITGEQFYKIGPAVESFADAVGKLLSGDLTPLTDLIPPEIKTIVEALANNDPTAFFQGLDALGQSISNTLSTLWPQVQPGLETFLTEMRTSIEQWITEQLPVWQANLQMWGQAFVEWIGPKIPEVITALQELAGQLLTWVGEQSIQLATSLLTWGQEFVKWLGPQVPVMLGELGAFLGEMVAWLIADAVPTLILATQELSKALVDWVINDAIPNIGPKLVEFNEAMQTFFTESVLPGLAEFGRQFVGSLIQGITEREPGMKEKWGKIYANIQDAVKSWQEGLVKLGNSIVDHILSGITQNVSHVITTVRGMVQDALKEAGKALGDFNPFGGGSAGGGAVVRPPGAAGGGILSGPLSGFPAILHGTEAVIPLNGGGVPVELRGGGEPRSRLTLEVPLFIDGRQVGSAIYDGFLDEAEARGKTLTDI